MRSYRIYQPKQTTKKSNTENRAMERTILPARMENRINSRADRKQKICLYDPSGDQNGDKHKRNKRMTVIQLGTQRQRKNIWKPGIPS